jgi:hypothetical protein
MMIEILRVVARKHDHCFQPWLYFDNNLEYNHQLNYIKQYQVTRFLNKVNEELLNH